MQRERKRRFGVNAIISLTDDGVDAETSLSLSLSISISLLRSYTFFSRSPLVSKTLFELAKYSKDWAQLQALVIVPANDCAATIKTALATVICPVTNPDNIFSSCLFRGYICPAFPLNFFMRFSQKMPLNFFFTTVLQKSQEWPKTHIKGGVLPWWFCFWGLHVYQVQFGQRPHFKHDNFTLNFSFFFYSVHSVGWCLSFQ